MIIRAHPCHLCLTKLYRKQCNAAISQWKKATTAVFGDASDADREFYNGVVTNDCHPVWVSC